MNSKSVSVAFQTDKPVNVYGELAQTVEAYGFAGVAVYNDMLYQPAWLPLMEMARATHKIRVGVAAVNPFTSHPVNIAGNIALIDEVSQGRAYLGVARGGWLDYVGVYPQRAVTALREALGCVRHLLSQSKEPFAAEIFPLAGGEALRWQILRPDVPFLLGTWGVKTIQACIEEIAEVKLGGTANPAVIPQIRRAIDDAPRRASNPRETIGIVAGAVTVVDEDGPAARQLARREAALYLSIIAKIDRTLGIEPELMSRIDAASAVFDFEQVGRLISDELLDRLAFCGTPEQVAEQALRLFEAGVQRVEYGTPHGFSAANGLRLLGEEVLPILHDYGIGH